MKNTYSLSVGLTLLIVGCGNEAAVPVSAPQVPAGNVRILTGASTLAGSSARSARITVANVRLVRAGSDEEVELSSKEDSVELKPLCNGTTRSIAENSIPAGDYDGVHIVISSASLDLDDSSHFDFAVPDDEDRDIRIHLPHLIRIDSAQDTDIQLDIDLDKSFAEQEGCPSGEHHIIFKPVVNPVVTPVTPASA